MNRDWGHLTPYSCVFGGLLTALAAAMLMEMPIFERLERRNTVHASGTQ